MNFEDFKTDIESKLVLFSEFELQEYLYQPYKFGNGMVAYRVNGRNHKFIFDGRENELTWLISKPHEKYFGAEFISLKAVKGLNIDNEELEKEINNSAQHRV